MSIIRAVTNPYGPATLDIQIEQGSELTLQFDLTRSAAPWVITNSEIDAHFSTKWSPGGENITLTVTKDPVITNRITITYPAASSLALALPYPPKSLPRNSSGGPPRKFELGGWILNIKDSGGTWKRVFDGNIILDRDPWLT